MQFVSLSNPSLPLLFFPSIGVLDELHALVDPASPASVYSKQADAIKSLKKWEGLKAADGRRGFKKETQAAAAAAAAAHGDDDNDDDDDNAKQGKGS